MKPETLEFCGVNSFSERAEINFAALTEYGIFGIFGDTGSGKSTVLDCISFALYGDVARSKGSLSEIINYRLDKAYVNFEFTIYYEGVRRRFRVERELKRKNAVQSVRVYERKGDTLSALSEGVRESNALLLKIVGLEQKDFEKCIALPQGEFAQFVKSARAERLKLVSRLFNLEKYGEGLFKRTNAKFNALREETNLVKARLEPYEEITGEYLKSLGEQIKAYVAEEERMRAELDKERAEERRLAALCEKSEERARLALKMQALENDKAAMKALDGAISRLEKAAAAVTRAAEYEEAREKCAADEANLQKATESLARAAEACEKLSAFDAEAAEAEIEKLTALLLECRDADSKRREFQEKQRRLAELSAEQRKEAQAFPAFCYEQEREAIDGRLNELGDDGDFFTFAEKYGKAALLRGEYLVFAQEIQALMEKYAQIEPDAAPLAQKYRTLSAGEKTDFSALRAAFEARRAEREALSGERLALEKRKARYDIHLNALQTMESEFRALKARTEELQAGFEGKAESAEIETLLKRKREEKKAFEGRKRAADEAAAQAKLTLAAAHERLNAARNFEKTARERLDISLAAGEFETVAQAKRLLADHGNAEDAKRQVAEYKENYAAVRSRLRELTAEGGENVTRAAVAEARQKLEEREKALKELSGKLAVARSTAEGAAAKFEKKRELEARFKAVCTECERYERLKKLLEGNKFMEFVAEEYLQTVALNASKRLLGLTSGRYFLRYDGGFFVGDNFDGGNARAVATLSGGETFLVSLSLALALSAEICARSLRPIEFFFLDEGFGTLDEKLVDVVMNSLEKLKGERLTVGIISHVEELKHRINRKLLVKKATEKHGSQILTE